MATQPADTDNGRIEGLEDDRQPALWPADSINSLLIRTNPGRCMTYCDESTPAAT